MFNVNKCIIVGDSGDSNTYGILRETLRIFRRSPFLLQDDNWKADSSVVLVKVTLLLYIFLLIWFPRNLQVFLASSSSLCFKNMWLKTYDSESWRDGARIEGFPTNQEWFKSAERFVSFKLISTESAKIFRSQYHILVSKCVI